MRRARVACLLTITVFAAGCASVGLLPPRGPKPGAIARLEERSAAEPENPLWLYRLGQAYEVQGDFAAAESALRAALARDAAHAPTLSLLSKIYYESGRSEKAVTLLEESPRRGSMPEELVLALALNYEALGRIDEAAELVASLESGLSNWRGAGSAVAYLRLKGEEYARSLEIARKALDAESSAVNHNNYGIALLYSGDPRAAKKSFLTARKIDSDLPGPLYNLAIVDWFYFFDPDGARHWFQQYTKVSSEDPDGLAEILTAEAMSAVRTEEEELK